MTKQKRIGARKEQILKAAEMVFAEKGFQQATISEIAREAQVSDATIYEYFPTKEELLFSIPFEITRKGKKDLLSHLNLIRGASNKLRAVIYWYLRFFSHNPDYASVVMLILKSNREFLKTDTYQVVREWARLFIDIVKEGIDAGEFREDIDPYLVRSVILGTIEHSVISWLLLGRPKDLLSLVDKLTDLVVKGIQMKDNLRGWTVHINLESPQGEKQSKILEVQ
jgi:AcrR family transcriptional regulator